MAKKIRFDIDTGNNDTKYHAPATSIKHYFPSLVAELPEHRTQEILKRGNMPDGFIVVNGTGYAIGDIAKNHKYMKLRGSARYVPKWYKPVLAYALDRVFGADNTKALNIDLGVMYPPKDFAFLPDIEKSAFGDYEVVSNNGTRHYTVSNIQGLDEGLGAFCMAWLTEFGSPRKNVKFGKQTVLVIDVGGYTTDVIPVDEGCNVDTTAMDGVNAGVQDIKESLDKYIRSEYFDILKKGGTASIEFPVASIEKALHTGYYVYGKRQLDVRSFVDEQATRLANEVYELINSYGGANAYNLILMGGGGGAFLQPYLNNMFGDTIEFKLAADDQDMRYSNVLGVDRFFKMLDMVG